MEPPAAAPLFGRVRPVGARGDGVTISASQMPDSRSHFERGPTRGVARLLGRWPPRFISSHQMKCFSPNDMIKDLGNTVLTMIIQPNKLLIRENWFQIILLKKYLTGKGRFVG